MRWARLAVWPGEEKLALDCFNQALTTMRAAGGDQEGEAAALQGIGEVYIRLGEMQKALTNLNQALALWRAAHDPYDEVTPLNEIGDVYAKMGIPGEGQRIPRASEADAESGGSASSSNGRWGAGGLGRISGDSRGE